MERPSTSNKSYAGDNRLIFSKSSYRWKGLAPRCWLNISWRGSTFQGFGCSPIKMLHELSSDRCETGQFISSIGVRMLKSVTFSTRGPKLVSQWCLSYYVNSNAQ